jgi:guanylate kinase/deoxycytidine triphosphate deaminase
MLVILFGPSGVGKTSLSRLLERDAGYHSLVTYTTREPRVDEDDRKSLDDLTYDDEVKSERIQSTSQVFGYRYGLDKSQLREALASLDKVYLVDFALENVADIDTFPGHKLGILIMPPDAESLEKRLEGHGQNSRIAASKAQFEYCLRAEKEGLPELIGMRSLVNTSLGETARRVQEMVERATLRAGGSVTQTTSFLSDAQILRALRSEEIFERGTWVDASIHQASYGLRIDTVAQLSAGKAEAETGERRYTMLRAQNGYFELAPGDSALLQSVERFQLKPTILGIVIPRGLLVANSLAPGSSYVDPGFKGFFTIPVTNVSGRVVHLPAGMEAARVLFAELEHVVGRPWSAADATSLRAELAAFPGRLPISRNELRSMETKDLMQRIRGEAPLGAETAEALDRARRAMVAVLVLAVVWPISLWVFNSDLVRGVLHKVFSDNAGFVANIAAGLVTSGLVYLFALLAKREVRANK